MPTYPEKLGAATQARVEVPVAPVQALHGDAHLGNVRLTASGLRWLDWEESLLP